MSRLKVLLVAGYLVNVGSGRADRYFFSKLRRYPGCPVAKVLYVSVAILKFIRYSMGSQCRLKRRELEGRLGGPR